MAEALAAIGLASSIITFIDFSKDFGRLVRSISKGQGSLPKELEECHEYVGIVVVWLEDARRSIDPISTTADEDQHLQDAIQRCSQTATELLALLESVSSGSVPEENSSLVQRGRGAISSVKKAGKIMWKREHIIDIRDSLRANKDNVHHHISSRTGRQVTRLLEGQLQLDGSLQVIDRKIVGAIGHFQHLQLQNDHLVMQNNILLQKVDFLCDVVAAMERDRRNRLLDVFDFLPPKPSVASVFLEMKSAASTINDARRSLFHRQSRPRVGGREMMMRLANKPTPPEDGLNLQVIVKSYFAPFIHKTSLVNFKRGDFRNCFALSKALRSGPEPIEAEKLSGFRSTTRITYVRFHHDEGSLSITESRDSGVTSDFYLRSIPDSLYSLRSFQPLEIFSPDRLGTQCSTSQTGNDMGPRDDWGIYIERDWEPWVFGVVGPYNILLVAGVTKLAAFGLQHFEVVRDSISCSLLLLLSFYLVFLPSMIAGQSVREGAQIIREDFWVTFVWVGTFALAAILVCTLFYASMRYRTVGDFVAFMLFFLFINDRALVALGSMLFYCLLVLLGLGLLLIPSTYHLKWLCRKYIRPCLPGLIMACCAAVTLGNADFLFQTRTNTSHLAIVFQTTKSTITTINSILGKRVLILIGIPLYTIILWWFIGTMPYFKFMKQFEIPDQGNGNSYPFRPFRPTLIKLYKYCIRRSSGLHVINFEHGRTRTANVRRKFGRWRKRRYALHSMNFEHYGKRTTCERRKVRKWRKRRCRQNGKLCQRLRVSSKGDSRWFALAY